MSAEKQVTIDDVMRLATRYSIFSAHGSINDNNRAYEDLRTAVEAYGRVQQAAVQGEPVAWVSPAYFVGKLYGFTISPIKVADGQIPLYAAPQQKQEPLTDEQIADVCDKAWDEAEAEIELHGSDKELGDWSP